MANETKPSNLFNEFFSSEKASGIVLIICTLFSFLLTNSSFGGYYLQLWNLQIGGESTVHWVNDGLMTIFFLLIGLELEREFYIGELSSFKKASLPLVAALGGMLIPAGIFLFFNIHKSTQSGAGIPMATDIAFAVGVLSLLGKRVPLQLKIFLTAIAVIDDLGAILVIAVFYAKSMVLTNLALALAVFVALLVMNKMKVLNLWIYLFGGIIMWYFMLRSGVHATITGVMLAFAIPFEKGGENSISYKLQHRLHKPVAFIILPMFALANTAILIHSGWQQGLTHSNSIGIFVGLILGKPLGIFFFSLLAVQIGFCSLPAGLKWKEVFGVGLLGGIGFTMSIFITLLAFENPDDITSSKIAILLSSLVAAFLGYFYLRSILKKAA